MYQNSHYDGNIYSLQKKLQTEEEISINNKSLINIKRCDYDAKIINSNINLITHFLLP